LHRAQRILTVTPRGPEALKAALRRSFPIIFALVLIGVVGFNALRQLQGPRYEASSRVLLAQTDLGAMLTGVQQPFIDPEEIQERELALASSPELYKRVSERTEGELGTGSEIEDATTLDAADQVLVFAVTTDDPGRSVDLANSIASEYLTWRTELAGAAISKAIAQIETEIRQSGSTRDLRENLNTLRVLETLNSGSATLLESADEAVKTSPAPIRDSVLGAAIGLVIALLLVGAREALSTRVRSESEVEEILELPVLGSVQSFPKRAKLVMFGRHEQAFADTYALLAANLVQNRNGTGQTMVAVTSAVQNEGKTLTASNLAVALARRGENVILVDLDLRKPTIHDVFRLPPRAPGVVQALAGEAKVEDLLWRVALQDEDDDFPRTVVPPRGRRASNDRAPAAAAGSLFVLPSGGSLRAGSVAQSAQLPEVLAKLRTRADVILLDTPPALQAAEMAELSRHVDAVLVVVRQRTATHRSLRSFSRQAQSWPTTLVGAVLTDTEAADGYSYYFRG
jgi:succinoglycan biosynthesis transport protein ExoP